MQKFLKICTITFVFCLFCNIKILFYIYIIVFFFFFTSVEKFNLFIKFCKIILNLRLYVNHICNIIKTKKC